MKFKKQDLVDMAWDDHNTDEYEVISKEIVDTSRWSIHHSLVFKKDDKFYRTGYSIGATESQDESPYEYDPDMIDCDEVIPVEKTITVYEKV